MKQKPLFLWEKRTPCEGLLGKGQKEKKLEIPNSLSLTYFIPIWFAIFKCQHFAPTWEVLFLFTSIFSKKESCNRRHKLYVLPVSLFLTPFSQANFS